MSIKVQQLRGRLQVPSSAPFNEFRWLFTLFVSLTKWRRVVENRSISLWCLHADKSADKEIIRNPRSPTISMSHYILYVRAFSHLSVKEVLFQMPRWLAFILWKCVFCCSLSCWFHCFRVWFLLYVRLEVSSFTAIRAFLCFEKLENREPSQTTSSSENHVVIYNDLYSSIIAAKFDSVEKSFSFYLSEPRF